MYLLRFNQIYITSANCFSILLKYNIPLINNITIIPNEIHIICIGGNGVPSIVQRKPSKILYKGFREYSNAYFSGIAEAP